MRFELEQATRAGRPRQGGRAALRHAARRSRRSCRRRRRGSAEHKGGQRHAEGRGGRRGRGRGGVQVDRHPGDQHAGGRGREAAAHRGPAAPAGGGPGRGAPARGQRGAALARGPGRPAPAHRLVPLHGPHRRGQDRAGPGPGRVPLRRREGHGPHRHVRVHGEARGVAPHRRAARATWATTRAASSPRPSAAGPTRWCSSTRSRRPTPTSSTSCCRCWTTAGSPTARAAPWTSATRS